MKPSFALDFRDGVIALHHRTARGWQQVGSVALDAADLGEALNYMRSTALGLSPRGLATKLVIPNDQILYTQVYAPGPDAAKRRRQIKAAIEGLTPYPVDDLVFDWWGNGPEVQVAVIARETLAEAEAFASEHRFNPVSFVGVPDNDGFQAEPFFGPSALSSTLLAPGEKVERDQDPISVVAREFPRSEPAVEAVAADVPVADVKLAEETPGPAAVPPPEPVPVAADPPPEPAAKVETLPEAPATPAPPASVAEPSPLPDFRAAVPPPPDRAFDPKTMAVDLVDEAPMAVDVPDDAPLAETPPPMVTAQVIAPIADEVPESPAAEVIAAFATRRSAAGAAASKPTVVSDSAKPTLGSAPALGAAPAQRPSVARPTLARPPAAAPVAARGTLPFPSKAAPPVARPAVAGKPAKGMAASVTSPGIAGARRDRNVVPLPTAAAPAAVAEDAPKPAVRPGSKTGLDGRPLPASSRPRYLGLILTGLLLLALVLVAAWSTFLTSDDQSATPAADSAIVPPAAAPETTTEAGAAAPDADLAVAEDPQSGGLPTAEDEALADGQDPALIEEGLPAEAALIDPAAAAQADAQAADAQAAADQAAADQAAADQAAADQAAATQAALDQAAAEAAAQAAADLAAAEAARPEPAPDTQVSTEAASAGAPGADPQDEIFLASADIAPATFDPLTLPQPEATGDPPAIEAPPPPPFGTVYQFDADGRIKPTPEEIMTPEGVLLVLGPPKLVPPARPATLAVAPVTEVLPAVTATLPDAETTLPGAALPDTTTASTEAEPVFSDPALAGKKPRPRPAGLAVPTTTVKQGDALAPALDSRFADLRPQPRPGGRSRATAADASLAADLQPAAASKLALNVSLNPPTRPDGLNQAVEAAVAAAVKAPDPQTQQTASAEPEAQLEPEVESAAPRLPTSASVAKMATDKRAINTGKIALIAVMGTASSRYAMVRQPSGAVKTVRVGDTIDGGRIAAISATTLQYQKGGRMLTLSMPAG